MPTAAPTNRELLTAIQGLDVKFTRKFEEQDKEIRKNGVMIGHLDDKISAVAEQHGSIIGRLDGIDGRLDQVEQRLDGQAEVLAHVAEDVTDIKSRLSVVEAKA